MPRLGISSSDTRPETSGVPCVPVPLEGNQVGHEKDRSTFQGIGQTASVLGLRTLGTAPRAGTLSVLVGKVGLEKLQAERRLLPDWSGSRDASLTFFFLSFFLF